VLWRLGQGLKLIPLSVMAGLVPAIHAFLVVKKARTWMPGTRPGIDAEASSAERSAILNATARTGLMNCPDTGSEIAASRSADPESGQEALKSAGRG